jgi:radical SAM protein with 4Fe4S-binding SPASM domain
VVTIIVEPTAACNASCAYCYVAGREATPARVMSPETLELLFVRIGELLAERPGEKVGVVWHGGEPLLAGPRFFAAAVELQRRHCPGIADRIRHAIQTNLTLLTEELAGLLGELGIHTVGTSCDPATDLRGLGRARDAEAYARRHGEGLALLQRMGLQAGVIYVVTRPALDRPLEVFRRLTELPVTGPIDLSPVVLADPASELGVTGEEYAAFLGAIFPSWWAARDRHPEVGPFSLLTRNLLEGVRQLPCRDSGRCAYVYVNVAPDGRLSHCNRTSACAALDYGNLRDRTLTQVLADPRRKPLLARNRVLFEGECSGCRFWPICHGGCPMDSWTRTGSMMHRTLFCEAKRAFIERHVEPLIGGCPGLTVHEKGASLP